MGRMSELDIRIQDAADDVADRMLGKDALIEAITNWSAEICDEFGVDPLSSLGLEIEQCIWGRSFRLEHEVPHLR